MREFSRVWGNKGLFVEVNSDEPPACFFLSHRVPF